jgi:hypothetical protein
VYRAYGGRRPAVRRLRQVELRELAAGGDLAFVNMFRRWKATVRCDTQHWAAMSWTPELLSQQAVLGHRPRGPTHRLGEARCHGTRRRLHRPGTDLEHRNNAHLQRRGLQRIHPLGAFPQVNVPNEAISRSTWDTPLSHATSDHTSPAPRIVALTCRFVEPPVGIEPTTYALRGRRATAQNAPPAPIAHPRAPGALGDLGGRRNGFHEGFHEVSGPRRPEAGRHPWPRAVVASRDTEPGPGWILGRGATPPSPTPARTGSPTLAENVYCCRRQQSTSERDNPCYHLADRALSGGELQSRQARHEAAPRALLSGRKIQQGRDNPLPHRAEHDDRRLPQRLVQPSVQLLGQRPRKPGIGVRRRRQRP